MILAGIGPDLAQLIHDLTGFQWAGIALTILGYLIPIGLVPHVLLSRRDRGTTTAWIVLIVLVPYIGALIYWILGHRKIAKIERRALSAAAATRRELDGTAVRGFDDPDLEAVSRVARRCGAPPALSGNAVALFDDNRAAFDAMLEAIDRAQKTVELEVYIFRPDGLGHRFLDALARAASRGVAVRLLVDGVGAWTLANRHLAPLVRAGGQVRTFLPVLRPRWRPRINFRLHRKLLVVDDRTSFLGSLNVADELLGKRPPWREVHARIDGPAAPVARETFEADWLFAGGEPRLGAEAAPARAGDEVVQIFASGPTEQQSATERVLFAAIAQAKEEVLAATPYFVPSRQLLAAFETAALRGARVRIVVPGVNDIGIVQAATRFTVPGLREVGVDVLSLRHEMLHAKVTVVDRKLAVVGSANLDRRSLDLSFELNALLLGGPSVQRARASVLHMCARAEPLLVGSRPLAGRLVDACARILAPVL